MLASAQLAAWLEAEEWRVVAEREDRIVAERRVLGTPHDWQALFLQQLPDRPWTGRLTLRTPLRPHRAGVYGWGPSHSSPDLATLDDVGLWMGGILSMPVERSA